MRKKNTKHNYLSGGPYTTKLIHYANAILKKDGEHKTMHHIVMPTDLANENLRDDTWDNNHCY